MEPSATIIEVAKVDNHFFMRLPSLHLSSADVERLLAGEDVVTSYSVMRKAN